jgi:thiaminase/transcriptional activator TenA
MTVADPPPHHPAGGTGGVSPARALWQDSADLAAAALAHPFVCGIADGTLSRDRFAGYIAQDAFFLESFARAYALAIAHSPDRAGLHAFADLLDGVRAELTLHAAYALRWGIDLSTVTPAPATLAYTDFLLATAGLGGVGLTCAAMTPCMRLYAHLGQCLARRRTSDRYAEWVDTYADPAFETLAATLEGLLDTYAGPDAGSRCASTYRRAMRLELAFFDSAFDPARRADPEP